MRDHTTQVLAVLGSIALLGLGGIIYLAAQQLPTPSVLEVVVGGAVASVGTLLARGGSSSSDVTPRDEPQQQPRRP